MPRGGHFAALEEPEILAVDIQKFVDKVEKKDFSKWKRNGFEAADIASVVLYFFP